MGYSHLTNATDITLPKLHNIVQDHVDATLTLLPEEQHTAILNQYNAVYHKYSEHEANLFILHLRKHYKVVAGIPYYFIPAFLRVFIEILHKDKTGSKLKAKIKLISDVRGYWCLGFDGDLLNSQAKLEARRCERIINRTGLLSAIDWAIGKGVLAVDGCEEAQQKRLIDIQWWKRQLKRIHTQGREALAQVLGLTSKYISKQGYNHQQQQHEATILMLSKNVAVSPEGKEVNLLDIAMTAIKGRFSRLLCWTDGMSGYAEKNGHSCAMYTLTCPSRMHPNSKKYDGTTTREAQQYLSN